MKLWVNKDIKMDKNAKCKGKNVIKMMYKNVITKINIWVEENNKKQ